MRLGTFNVWGLPEAFSDDVSSRMRALSQRLEDSDLDILLIQEAWTREVWVYDYRTNIHHTLKKKPLRYEDLADFVACYQPSNRHGRQEKWHEIENPEGRWRKFSYEQIVARDKTSLDIFWLKDKSLADLDNLPEPDELAGEIIENLEAGLNSFREIAAALA